MKHLIFTLLLFAAFTSYRATAQIQLTNPCPADLDSGGGSGGSCDPNLNLNINTYNPVPLSDGSGNSYGDPGNNIVSLYGAYGNDESKTAKTHYQLGITQGTNIVPLCRNGLPPQSGQNGLCIDVAPAYQPAIVFLFIGFSNCDIEICGGNSDAWDNQDDIDSFTQQPGYNCHLAGQPCATQCPNIGNQNPQFTTWWNQVTRSSNASYNPSCSGGDGVTQKSLIYQIYSPSPQLAGPHVAVFDGAFGSQTLDRWDPTSVGWYAQHNDCQGANSNDPECNYDRVALALGANGFSPAQVQAIFLKAANSYPQCDLKLLYCNPSYLTPLLSPVDAYQAEQYLGDIMRFLKKGLPKVPPPYPNLQQVFLTSRTYGGYANSNSTSGNGSPNGCLDPEPFAYEEGFAIQRLIVAQITGTPDTYSGAVDTGSAPWFDWGPYLWANGATQSPSTGLYWCEGQSGLCNGSKDFRYGDPTPGSSYFGDFTHPTYTGQQKVATQLVEWITGTLPQAQQFLSPFVTGWMPK